MAKSELENKKSNPKKEAKKAAKIAVLKEKDKLLEEIVDLEAKKKAASTKAEKQKIQKEIKELKERRSKVGKKDSFIGDIKAEMKLVRWPSKNEVLKYSIACLAFVLFFALFYYGIDLLFAFVKGLFN